jgi:hypothetical protein
MYGRRIKLIHEGVETDVWHRGTGEVICRPGESRHGAMQKSSGTFICILKSACMFSGSTIVHAPTLVTESRSSVARNGTGHAGDGLPDDHLPHER